MSKKHRYSVLRLLFPLLLALPFPFTLMNCARESAPLGGPVDTIAPYAVLEKPFNNTPNINPKKIVIKFNEFIALENVDDNCMIAPIMEEKPEFTVKKKKLIIDISKQKLQPNTTYSFNFNNAIKDLTESNFTEQYIYAFSTGSGIDTMKLAGTVSYAKDGKIPANAYVLLYDNLSDTAFQTQKPRYITQISKKGDFSFSNIEAKPYKIYALEDSDKDFTFNQVTEKIAFLDTIFNPTAERFMDSVWFTHNDTIRFKEFKDSIQIVQVKDSFNLIEKTRWSDQDIKLSIFENEVWNQEILSSKRISKYVIGYKLAAKNNFPRTITFSPEGLFKEEKVGADSLLIWLIDTTLQNSDSTTTLLSYSKNSQSDELIIDTIPLEQIKDVPERLLITSSLTQNNKVFSGDSITITLSRPIQTSHLDKIALYALCDTTAQNYNKLQVSSDHKFRPKKHYQELSILKYKEANDRFALYFSKPINQKDVKVTLDGLPNLTDWYYCERDEQSGALLYWIKAESDALKLKNQAITVEYPRLSGEIEKTNFNLKKDVPVQKMYKNAFSNKKLILQMLDEQKNAFKIYEPIRIYCNNPISTITDSLFTLIDLEDSIENSIITTVSILENSNRIIEIYHSAKKGTDYTLTLRKGAVIDTFGMPSREFVTDIHSDDIDDMLVLKQPFSITPSKTNERTFAIHADWKTNSNYVLIIPDSTFFDVFEDANDSISYSFQCPKKEGFGNLLVKNNQGFPSNKFVFVIDSDDEKNPTSFIGKNTSEGILFENIPATTYMLYCFEDANSNKQWDNGCIEIKRQPEKIYIFKETITVKSEWDNTIHWDEF